MMIVSDCDKLFSPDLDGRMHHGRAVTAHAMETHGDRARAPKVFLRLVAIYSGAAL